MTTNKLRQILLLAVIMASGEAVYAEVLLTTGDTKVLGSQPNANSGKAGWLHVARGSHVLLAFDVTGSGATAESRLQLRIINGGVRGPGPIGVYQVTSPWTEQAATWATQPQVGPLIASYQPDEQQVARIDITELVNRWISQPATNFGVILKPLSNSTEVIFMSREYKSGLFPPQLEVRAIQTLSNSVTVAMTGGDYADPAEAAGNAFTGDKWCADIPDLNGADVTGACTIDVEPGIYVVDQSILLPGHIHLVGAGTHNTVIKSAAEVGATVIVDESSGNNRIANLSILNQSGDSSQSIGILVDEAGGSVIEDVEAYAGGSMRNVALSLGHFSGVNATNLFLSAEGGSEAVGIDVSDAADLVLSSSEIRVTNADSSNVGVALGGEFGTGTLKINDSSVWARGGQLSKALALGNPSFGERTARTEVFGSRFVAQDASVSNFGFVHHGQLSPVLIDSTEFIAASDAVGATNVALEFEGRFFANMEMKRVHATAEGNSANLTIALRRSNEPGGDLTISDSRLIARTPGAIAVQFSGYGFFEVANISHSIIHGEAASINNEVTDSDSSSHADFSDSTIVGPVTGSGTLTLICSQLVVDFDTYLASGCP